MIGPDNAQLGILTTEQAFKAAQDAGYDLVLVADNAEPPVCRIMNFGKFVYEQNKKERDNKKKQAAHRNKEIKFKANIDEHDYLTKVGHILDFLKKGNRVKVSLQFRGREMAHRELGIQVMHRVVKDCEGSAVVELPPRLMGKSVIMQLAPIGQK